MITVNDLPTAPTFTDTVWRISVERYHAMINAGVLTPEDQIELLFGQLIKKMTINPSHRIATIETSRLLSSLIPQQFFVQSQQPITTKDSEPEPDVSIVQGGVRDYMERHPYPEEVALVIEVSDATLQRDQNTKKALYAQTGIAVYWIVNLVHEQIEVYSAPHAGMYAELRTYRKGDEVPVVVDGVEIGRIPTATLLP